MIDGARRNGSRWTARRAVWGKDGGPRFLIETRDAGDRLEHRMLLIEIAPARLTPRMG
jgi:hypothetical protein